MTKLALRLKEMSPRCVQKEDTSGTKQKKGGTEGALLEVCSRWLEAELRAREQGDLLLQFLTFKTCVNYLL